MAGLKKKFAQKPKHFSANLTENQVNSLLKIGVTLKYMGNGNYKVPVWARDLITRNRI